ncbi:hypothetical protein [Cupriavidus sp. WS]|uniref:hypothetical protein n=1 Tax=Cupriavidus sp. WS TaxID=1312922 RepID=UPI000379B0E0|nr:hypothetical protein [Cupriavidus sp. WS]
MELNLDGAMLNLACPKCGHQFEETVGRLKDQPDVTCSACGTVITIDLSQLHEASGDIQKELTDLERMLGDSFK